MTLPTLPRQLKKREADFGETLRKYLKKYPIKSGPLELKQTTDNSIPFSCITARQVGKLRDAKGPRGALDKFSDAAYGFKPYDYAYYRYAPSFVVILFKATSARGRGEFHFIDIDVFMQQKEQSKQKSLTIEVARQISARYGKI